MNTVKDEARQILDRLPEDVGRDELVDEIELHARMVRGLADMKAGRTVPAAEIERKYGIKH